MITKYQQIADDLFTKIKNNEYQVGTMIPPESKLREIYQVSRYTIRQAIGVLVDKGYLRAEKGAGTYVLDPKIATSQKPTKTIGVITTYLSDYIFPTIIEGIEEVLRSKGYALLVSATHNDSGQEESCLQAMLAQGIDGLLIEPTSSNQYNPNIATYAKLKERGLPILFLNAYYDMLDIPYVSLDDSGAGELATRYLIEQGHKNIGLLAKLDDLQGKLRMKGYIRAHKQKNLDFSANHIATFDTQNQKEIIKTFAKSIAEKQQTPTAVVCYNDEVASYLIQQLHKYQLFVPKDISIVSHDNSYLAKVYQLTGIIHPQKQLGQYAAEQLIQNVEKQKPLQSKEYPAELKERNSVLKHDF
ncbi:GntR family transcriptional regulator [Streptococcus merionis]|uniref:GntR family transcriptional regulator n=1 Tax=Streptococcus merionis TaxID=400065 RepID=UPI003517437B